MPKLPGPEALGPRQAPKPATGVATYSPVNRDTPSLRTPVGDLGAPDRARVALGDAEIGFGSSIEVAAQHEQDRQNILAAEDAYTKLKNKQLDLTFGKDGFTTLKGGAAINPKVFPDYEERFGAAAAEIADGLANGEQRALFAQRAGVANVQYKEGILRHVMQENDTYATDVFNGITATAIRSATANWNSPVEVAAEFQRVDEALKNRAERQHWPDEYTESQRLKVHGAIHDAVISQADASGNYAYAADWYENHKGDIDKPTAEKLQVIVRNGRENQAVADYSTMLRQANNGLPALYELRKRVENDKILQPGKKEVLLEKIERIVLPVEAKNIADGVMTPQAADDLGRMVSVGVGAASAAANVSGASDQASQLAARNVAQLQQELARPGVSGDRKRILEEELQREQATAGQIRTGAAGPDGSPLVAKDTRAMLGEWVSKAEQEAERLHPGNVLFRDLAVSQVKTRVSTVIAVQEGMERQAHGYLLQTAAGIQNGQPGTPVTSLSDLLSNPQARAAWSTLDGNSQRGIIAYVEQNASRAEGRPTQISTRLEQQIFSRMVLPGDDPQAITRPEQLTAFVGQGLSVEGHSRLIAKMDQLKTPEGRGFQVRVDKVVRGASSMMSAGIVGQMLKEAQPEKLAQAQLDFQLDLDQKIEAYRAEGKDPGSLLTPGKPDYVGTYEHVASFLPSSRQALGDAAAKARTTPAVADVPVQLSKDSAKADDEFAKLAKGTRYIGPDGIVRTK